MYVNTLSEFGGDPHQGGESAVSWRICISRRNDEARYYLVWTWIQESGLG